MTLVRMALTVSHGSFDKEATCNTISTADPDTKTL